MCFSSLSNDSKPRKFCFCLMLVSKCFDPGWVMTLEYMNLQLKQYHFKTTKLKKNTCN